MWFVEKVLLWLFARIQNINNVKVNLAAKLTLVGNTCLAQVSIWFPYLQTHSERRSWCVRHLRTHCFSKNASLTVSNKSKCLEMLTAYAKPAYWVSNERSLRLSLKNRVDFDSLWLWFIITPFWHMPVPSVSCFLFSDIWSIVLKTKMNSVGSFSAGKLNHRHLGSDCDHFLPI